MKYILFIFLSFSSMLVQAQFNTIKSESNNYKVKIEKSCESIIRDSVSFIEKNKNNSRSDTISNRYSKLNSEQLSHSICAYEKALKTSKKVISKVPQKTHNLYKGKKRELNLYNLKIVMDEVGLSNKLFVIAQAVLETGNFSSRVCKKYNNLFGLYDSRNRDYFRFEKWEDSVIGYQKMIQYRYKGGNYLDFLRDVRYAEDPRYIPKVAKTAIFLYKQHKSLFKD